MPSLKSSRSFKPFLCGLCALLASSVWSAGTQLGTLDAGSQREFQQAIQQMRSSARGPFQRLRWFCRDGSILPPRSSACAERGGGRQHGEWSPSTVKLRNAGFYVGNVLAAIDADKVAVDPDPLGELPFILLEQFLIGVDDGWILRQARFYRGAFQVEAEERQAQAMLKALVSDYDVLERRYLLAGEIIRRLPVNVGQGSLLAEIRNKASAINRVEPAFQDIRNKIHGKLSVDDAQRVRDYLLANDDSDQAEALGELADLIEQLYDPGRLIQNLQRLEATIDNDELATLVTLVRTDRTATERFYSLSNLSSLLRRLLPTHASQRDELLAVLVQIEQAAFTDAQSIIQNELSSLRRDELLKLMEQSTLLLYGSGLLTGYELDAFNQRMQALWALPGYSTLAVYQQLLDYLARIPGWAERRVAFFFQPAITKLAQIEPLAHEFVPDRLRGSALVIYAAALERLQADAAQISEVRHTFFEKNTDSGFRALNPGIGTGVLHTVDSLQSAAQTDEVILIVPETLADLPPVNGILTAFEGNQLSHVQLLASNLGVPNVVVNAELLKQLQARVGERITLVASPGGIVQIEVANAAVSIRGEKTATPQPALIHVDVDKLDLTRQQALTLEQLSSADSGVAVGPKAAKVAELAKRFPGRVSPGIALPFGAFRAVLDLPKTAEQSWFDWITESYARHRTLTGTDRSEAENVFRETLQEYLLNVELPESFIAGLTSAMRSEFGDDGSYGVFVRSDTNVEDLAGFTGAGLNLTVPHVVGEEAIIAAIRRVWASPFSERAFGWRQARMDKPEHVYTAVLLHRSVTSDISGVLVTQDVFGHEPRQLSVVVNEGVAGGVDGLSAETVLLHSIKPEARLMASATAPYKRVLSSEGGAELLPASGRARLLEARHFRVLREFAGEVGNWFGDTVNDTEQPIADVEFGFADGQFVLFQIRPFVESEGARTNPRLQALDERLEARQRTQVELYAKPESP